ncbi:MAG: SEC-C domain-containing protein [Deltaproteobacteria bacterium]|nr:SEC-C domain-containing protein [Deltaproteobacteria bacterium]
MICSARRMLEVGCENIENCPTPSAHSRLNDAHRLWHQAEANYNDPDSFRVNLNACIQTLRNVTFVLQKEKSRIPNFDGWYAGWQSTLREDNILRWLVDARNVIVKEGDLETLSRVRVAILDSYNGSPHHEMNVEPMATTKDIAIMMASQDIPEQLKKDGVLRVERKWIAMDLPDYELLEAMSHSYGVLSTMILDAHSQSNASLPKIFTRNKGGSVKPHKGPITHLNGRLPCMVVESEKRTVRVKLSTNQLLTMKEFKIKKITKKVVTERYGNVLDHLVKPQTQRERLFMLLEWAKNILQTDGYHVPIVLFELKSNKLQILSFAMNDQAEKHLMARKLAQDAVSLGAKSITGIGEAWCVMSHKDKPVRVSPEELPDRTEALVIDYLSAEGEEFSIFCPFVHRNNSIEFGEVVENHRSNNIFYIPLRETWKRKRRLESSRVPLSKYKVEVNALCPCHSGKKYKKCCAPHIGTILMDTALLLYSQKEYERAEQAFRAHLTQYIKWYHIHTVPFLKHNREDAEEIFQLDIQAIGEIVDRIAECLLHQDRKVDIDPFLERTSDIIDDSRYAAVIGDLRKKFRSSIEPALQITVSDE